jgi:polar amino acid transport system permease protein
MTIRALAAMLAGAVIVIGILATRPEYRLFLPGLLQGAVLTVEIAVLGCLLAVVMGVLSALARMYGPAPVRWLATVYVEVFRGTSALVQLFWLFFVLPRFGVLLEPLTVAILALGLNVGAYGAEVVRGAIKSVGREQHEACTALNLGRWQRMRHVILPQALLVMLPTFGNNAIELLKATAVVSLISLADMTFQAQVVRAQTGNTAVPFVTILVLYFLIALVISRTVRLIERRMARGLDGVRS